VAADGTVGVSYYDFRNNTPAAGALTDYWLAYAPIATTNPSAWGEVRLTDSSFNLEQVPTRFGGDSWLGDYEGLASAGNDFVAVWAMPDCSSTDQESIFFRRVTATFTSIVAAMTSPATGGGPSLIASVAASQPDYLLGGNSSTAGHPEFVVQTRRDPSVAPPYRNHARALVPGQAHQPPRHSAVLDHVLAELAEDLSAMTSL
jgi:hypothetical protein